MLLYHGLVGIVALMVTLLSFDATQADTNADLETQLKTLAKELHKCQQGLNSNIFEMKLHYLDANTTCNDGSPAGYYLKKSHGSKRWLIYLEGGWFCTNRQSCDQRARSRMGNLMTSSKWEKNKTGSGMLSSNPTENPTWWNANHVWIPYCSSDAWSGNVTRYETGEKFSFLGSRIIEKVIEDLLPHGLYHGEQLLLAGSSAGAIGVLLNVDRVSYRLRSLGYDIEVRGLVDSGWYLDHLAKKTGCPKGSCDRAKIIKEGMRYWKGVVPDACAAKYPSEEWKCYFGNLVYPTLNSSTFIFQWLYDETQLALDGSGLPKSLQSVTKEQVYLIFSTANHLKHSLKRHNVHSVFAPSCLYHTILTDSNWLKTKVHGYTLDDALKCWLKTNNQNRVKCRSHLVQRCWFPQCNPSCPRPRDPYTGKPYKSLIKPGIVIPGINLNLNGNIIVDRGMQ